MSNKDFSHEKHQERLGRVQTAAQKAVLGACACLGRAWTDGVVSQGAEIPAALYEARTRSQKDLDLLDDSGK